MTYDSLDDLTDDGDIATVDGVTYRLRIEPDPDTSIEDYACYGRVAWCERDYATGRDRERPEGFNGRARKFSTNGDSYWWQPPDDVPDDQLDREARLVRDLVEYGFISVGLEILDGEDAYGRPIVRAAEWLGGVEAFVDAEYKREVITDLAANLEYWTAQGAYATGREA